MPYKLCDHTGTGLCESPVQCHEFKSCLSNQLPTPHAGSFDGTAAMPAAPDVTETGANDPLVFPPPQADPRAAASRAPHVRRHPMEARPMNPKDQTSIEVPPDLSRFRVTCGSDGVWLHFSASDGTYASFHVATALGGRGGVIGRAVNQWCVDREAQAERMAGGGR